MLNKKTVILLNEKYKIFDDNEIEAFLLDEYEKITPTKLNRFELLNEQKNNLNGITQYDKFFPKALLNEYPYKKGLLLSKGQKYNSKQLIIWCDEDYLENNKLLCETLFFFLKRIDQRYSYQLLSIKKNTLFDDILDSSAYKSLERFEILTKMYNSHLLIIGKNSKILNPLLENLINKNCYYLLTAFSDNALAVNLFYKNGITPITIDNIEEVIYEISNS
jgi:hypothetical protein